MIVRRINKNDLEKVKNIYALAFDTEVLVQIDYINQDIYVVCKDDLILGMCMVNYIDDIFVGKRTAYINAVIVIKKSCFSSFILVYIYRHFYRDFFYLFYL